MQFVVSTLLLLASVLQAAQEVPPSPSVPPTQGVVTSPQSGGPRPRLVKPGQNGATARSKPPEEIPPTAPVVTLHGVCAKGVDSSKCNTVLTREDLKIFMIGLHARDTTQDRARNAIEYATLLSLSELAEKRDLPSKPEVSAQLTSPGKLDRMRVLSKALLDDLRQEAVIPDSDVEKFYNEHRDFYEQFHVRRTAIPLFAPTASGARLNPDDIRAEMENLRSHAVAGDDLDVLLRRAFAHLQIQAQPPPSQITTLRKAELDTDQAKILTLAPGEFTPVLDFPAAFVIFKLESKDTATLAEVSEGIKAGMRAKAVQEKLRAFGKTVTAEFNTQFLGMTHQPDLFSLIQINKVMALAFPSTPERASTVKSSPGNVQE